MSDDYDDLAQRVEDLENKHDANTDYAEQSDVTDLEDRVANLEAAEDRRTRPYTIGEVESPGVIERFATHDEAVAFMQDNFGQAEIKAGKFYIDGPDDSLVYARGLREAEASALREEAEASTRMDRTGDGQTIALDPPPVVGQTYKAWALPPLSHVRLAGTDYVRCENIPSLMRWEQPIPGSEHWQVEYIGPLPEGERMTAREKAECIEAAGRLRPRRDPDEDPNPG